MAVSETLSAEEKKFIDETQRVEDFACHLESVASKLVRLAHLSRDPEVRLMVVWLLDNKFDLAGAKDVIPDLARSAVMGAASPSAHCTPSAPPRSTPDRP